MRHMERAESKKCPFTSDFKVGVSSDFKHPEVQEPYHRPEAGPLPLTPGNPPMAEQPHSRSETQLPVRFRGRWSEDKHGSPPWRDRRQVWPEPPRTLHPEKPWPQEAGESSALVSPAWEASTHQWHGSPWLLEPGPWDRVWGGASPWA